MKKTVYRSRVSVGLAAICYGSVLACAIPLGFDFVLGGAIVIVAILLFMSYFLFMIRYEIVGNKLVVKNVFTNVYDLNKLLSVSSSHTLLASPASSLHRLELRFSSPKLPLVISPRRQDEFIAQLRSINPNIEVNVE